MRIILASKSPRRREILKKHGYEPIVIVSDADERIPAGTPMEDAAKMTALKKAEACYAKLKALPDFESYEDDIILAADTIVYKDEIMGKPVDRDDAYRMLNAINGTDHYVATGVAILSAANGEPILNVNTEEVTIFCDVTRVWCKNMSEAEINEYIDSGEPYDKAGAYGIQGAFGKYIDHIEGDYENVVGLPFHRIEPYINNAQTCI